MFQGEELCTQRLDMIVDERVVVETKSTYELHPAAQRQLYNYLRATRLEVGLLFHFGREPEFYRLMCRNPTPLMARDLEHANLPPREHPNGDVPPDSPM
jgi:PD-(D/E)XK nuclease superfamily protein